MEKYGAEGSYLHDQHKYQYSSINSEAAETMDYETLISLALHSATAESHRRTRRRQLLIFQLIFVMVVLSVGLLTAITFFSYPEEEHLHDQIIELQTDIEDLGDKIEELTDEKTNETTAINDTSPDPIGGLHYSPPIP